MDYLDDSDFSDCSWEDVYHSMGVDPEYHEGDGMLLADEECFEGGDMVFFPHISISEANEEAAEALL